MSVAIDAVPEARDPGFVVETPDMDFILLDDLPAGRLHRDLDVQQDDDPFVAREEVFRGETVDLNVGEAGEAEEGAVATVVDAGPCSDSTDSARCGRMAAKSPRPHAA